MLILHTMLSPQALDDLLADYVTRDGTADGTFTTLEERKAQLLTNLEREEAFITYNYEHSQACLIHRNDVTPEALAEFAELKVEAAEQAESAREEAAAQEVFDQLFAELKSQGVFPIPLGRTVMAGRIGHLVSEGRLAIEQLQELLHKHANGDYGVLGAADRLANLRAIKDKDHMLSRYEVAGESLYVEMLAGHHQTMVMGRSDR